MGYDPVRGHIFIEILNIFTHDPEGIHKKKLDITFVLTLGVNHSNIC